ncbi:hypothetical protein B296_00016381 [Ensete ventricosum]|uniref:Uncharacterized protein n=1 Tax=Ensete ventricosum TaxID=4639 RepID=A0A426ZNF4_ENSVE|nr:hypothetical protein B296_00016381 [Ensete ventricosum]
MTSILLVLYIIQTLEMLEKKEKVLLKKMATEVEKAREFAKVKNKRGSYLQLAIGFHMWDELEAELEELEGAELEEQLLQPATTAPLPPVHVPDTPSPTRPADQKNTTEEDELATLQAEMAM